MIFYYYIFKLILFINNLLSFLMWYRYLFQVFLSVSLLIVNQYLSYSVMNSLQICQQFYYKLYLQFFEVFFELPLLFITFSKYSVCRFVLNNESFCILHRLLTKIMFILSSISSSLEIWSVNHTSICENSELKVFKNIKCIGDISKNWPACLYITPF